MLEQIDKDDEERKKVKKFIEDIRSEYSRIKNEKSECKRNYETKSKALMVELVELQKRCPHVRTEYHGDPSGNNDTSYECLDCGKEAKRL